MSVSLVCLPVGQLQANCYLLGCQATKEGAVVDPGGDADLILGAVREAGLRITHVLCTHGHPDHTLAAREVRDALAAIQGDRPRVAIHEGDREMLQEPALYWLLAGLKPQPCEVDDALTDGATIKVGKLSIGVMSLPGHSPGCAAFMVDDIALTGDVLFAGSIGRTDLPGGDMEQMLQSLRRLARELPPETALHPGHGPATTMARELAGNEWLQDI